MDMDNKVLKPSEIERIFNSRFEQDQKEKATALATVLNRNTVKANPFPNPFSLHAIPLYILASAYPGRKNKEKVAFFLATILEDLEHLSDYLDLVYKRRSDFVKNCLLITKRRLDERRITGSKSKYFWGVVRSRTKQIESLKKYKRKGS